MHNDHRSSVHSKAFTHRKKKIHLPKMVIGKWEQHTGTCICTRDNLIKLIRISILLPVVNERDQRRVILYFQVAKG